MIKITTKSVWVIASVLISYALFWIGVCGLSIYVIWHFVTKFW